MNAVQARTVLPDPVRTALESACAAEGFDAGGARVLQHHRNWVVRLPRATRAGAVVAKVHEARAEQSDVTRQVLTARWLDANGVRTARPTGTRPFVRTDGHLVTFSRDLGDGGPATAEELAALLVRLHALPVPEHLALPRLDAAGGLLARIEQLPDQVLAPDDRRWLTGHVRTLGERFDAADWPAPVVVHGDLNTHNTIRTAAGPALIDLECAAVGPALHDLAFPAWTRDGFGGDRDDYARFCAVYGTDVTTVHDGRPYARVLAPLRAAVGVVIALEAVLRDGAWKAEAAHRLACARGQGESRSGYPWAWSTSTAYARPSAPAPA
ncbi:phosphotransferase [Kitasatospora sp. NPDC001574]